MDSTRPILPMPKSRNSQRRQHHRNGLGKNENEGGRRNPSQEGGRGYFTIRSQGIDHIGERGEKQPCQVQDIREISRLHPPRDLNNKRGGKKGKRG